MIKSITIRDMRGRLLFRVICRKNGIYEMIRSEDLKNFPCEVRDEKNQKVFFNEGV